ncbi:MAG: sugar transferase [Aristaeellaceae bacterium]
MQQSENLAEETALSGEDRQRCGDGSAARQGLMRRRGGRLYQAVKRAADVALSLMMLVALSPVFLVISLLIVCTSEGPVIYRHRRIGRYGRPIDVLKFRTMVKDADQLLDGFTAAQRQEWQDHFKLEDDPRVTRIGRFLRRSSLDELPQLVNILRGEMSLIGPRPIVDEELEKYGARKEEFLSILPGLTGYWQAYARSDCDYERRMQMELEYVNHANLLWDVQILFATCRSVLQGKGAR